MPKLRQIIQDDDKPAACFLCARVGVVTPGANLVFYDDSVGTFDPENPPRICEGHKRVVQTSTIEQRRLVFAGFPVVLDNPPLDPPPADDDPN